MMTQLTLTPLLATADGKDANAEVVCTLLVCALVDAQEFHYAASDDCPGCKAIGSINMCADCWEPHYVPAGQYFELMHLLNGWGKPRPLTAEDAPVLTAALAEAITYRERRDDLPSRAMLAAYRELATAS
jgi:hypothetical protein